MDELNKIKIELRKILGKDLNKWVFYKNYDNNLCLYRKDLGITQKSVYSGDFIEESFDDDINIVSKHIIFINKHNTLIDTSNSSRLRVMRKRKWSRRFNYNKRSYNEQRK